MKKRFGEIATFSRGLTFSKGDVVSESSKRVLRSNNIDLSTHSLVFEDIACLKESFVIPDEKMLHRNDIFICMSNGSTQHLGKVAYISEEIGYAFGGFMGAIHPDESQIFPKYAFYACLSSEYRRFLASIFNGVNINNLKWSDLSDFRIPMLPLAEQERIVAELDLLQGIIDKQKAQLKELDTLAQSIFYDMFGDPVENEKGWRTDALKVVAPQKTYDGPVPGINGKYWLLNLDKVEQQTGRIIEYVLAPEDEIGSSTMTFDTSNILYSKLRPYLNKVVIPDGIGYGTSELVPLRPLPSLLNRVFFAYLLRSRSFVDFISVRVAGAKMPRVSMEALRDFPIILPPLGIQQSFATKVKAIERQKASINASIAETQKLFDYTMDKYFG